MAITLDELLGNNTQQSQQETSYDRFPSYEEFHAQRAGQRNMAQERYDFDVRGDANYGTSYAPTQNGFGQYQNPERSTFVQDSYAQTYKQPYTPTDLYDFTRRDKDRLSEEQLLEKLEHTDVSRRPIFDRSAEQTAETTRFGLFQKTAEKQEAVQGEKKRARLNTKGKIILGAYLGIIALVAVLIIVNASKINSGKAVTPSSHVQDNVAIVQIDK